jgi:hypothetical protein
MLRRLTEWLAAMAGLEVIDPAVEAAKPKPPKEPKPVQCENCEAAERMLGRMQREVELSHQKVQASFDDYEHRVQVLTEECERLKRR